MDNQNKKNSNNNRQGWGVILITTLLVTFVVMGLYSLMQGSSPEEISYDEFLDLVEDKKVEEVQLASNRIYITLTDRAREEESRGHSQTEALADEQPVIAEHEVTEYTKDISYKSEKRLAEAEDFSRALFPLAAAGVSLAIVLRKKR